ncbi:MAG: ATP synthase subunit b [Candidatus Woesebacteria bacterium GW2011_GWA1_39_21]|uniref:ATP synthase subunit b n=1 Tax=Candidatus Woesebacteria bacterium GW2011_GWA1_39_21 TaxID=1618550 RepID=A0A0G0NEX7_9BACT|nr:MAG: ATP synthase subunit b [Candidatus Woesebacteria bacterium GW2011_GWA1_39_21]
MEALGLDVRLLLFQIINFGMVLFVLAKLVYKPILKLLDERKKKVKETLEKNALVEEKLSNIENEERAVIKKAEQKADKISQELLNNAEEEKAKIIEEARLVATQESQKSASRVKATQLEAEANLKDKFKKQVVEELLEKLNKSSNGKQKFPMLDQLLK